MEIGLKRLEVCIDSESKEAGGHVDGRFEDVWGCNGGSEGWIEGRS